MGEFIAQPRLTPWPFQADAIAASLSGEVVENLSCGLGKTFIATEIARASRANSGLTRNLIILSPKSIAAQWEETIWRQEQWAVPIEIWDANTVDSVVGDGHPVWVMLHYASLKKYMPELLKYRWACVVAEECQKIKNRDAQRTKFLKKIRAAHKVPMTGTLMEKSPADLWSVLNWIRPKDYTSFWAFHNKYVYTQKNYMGYDEDIGTKPDMVEELGRELKPLVFRRTKQQVAPDMPPLIRTIMPIDLDPKQRALYDKIRKAKDIEVDLGGDEPELIRPGMSRFTFMHRIASDPAMLGFNCPSSKMEWVREYVDNNPGEQIVVFSRYRGVPLRLREELGERCALVIGGQAPQLLREFRAGDVQVLTATIGAGGEGLDFPMARTSIFVDCDWYGITMEQAVDRIHRLNITEPKQAIYLTARRTVDRLVRKALDRKWKESQLLHSFMEGADLVEYEGDDTDELLVERV